jgi:hypothetical protein
MDRVNHLNHYQSCAEDTRAIITLLGVPPQWHDTDCIEVIEQLAHIRQDYHLNLFTLFNAGVWVKFSTLQFTVPTSGNRSLQVRSVAGTADLRWITSLAWDSNETPSYTGTITPTSNQYLKSEWHFTGAGNQQTAMIEDLTNKKFYRVFMAIGGSYQNNVLVCSDIT